MILISIQVSDDLEGTAALPEIPREVQAIEHGKTVNVGSFAPVRGDFVSRPGLNEFDLDVSGSGGVENPSSDVVGSP